MTSGTRAWFSGNIKKSKTILRLWANEINGIFFRISNKNKPAAKNMMNVSQRIVQYPTPKSSWSIRARHGGKPVLEKISFRKLFG
jgi:hypothetical protein